MLRDVASDQLNEGQQARVVIDRATASRLGITPQMLDNALYDAFGQRQISTMFTQLNQYRVVLEADPSFQRGPEDLQHIYLQSAPGGPIPLSAFTHIETTTAPLSINHQATVSGRDLLVQSRARRLAGQCRGGSGPGQAGDRAAGELRNRISGHRTGVSVGARQRAAAYFGRCRSRSTSSSECLYESYIHPITILSTLPSAGVGALLALMLTGTEFTIIALIGIVLLIGIVEKNAIMMIDFALEAERTEHRAPEDAIFQAALLRFRPILMTTLAALFAGLPLALGTGTGQSSAVRLESRSSVVSSSASCSRSTRRRSCIWPSTGWRPASPDITGAERHEHLRPVHRAARSRRHC